MDKPTSQKLDNKHNQPKPVKKGQTLKTHIEYEGSKGDGVAIIEGFSIVVKNAKKNKDYEIEINEVRNTYAFANIIREIPNRTATEIMQQADKKED